MALFGLGGSKSKSSSTTLQDILQTSVENSSANTTSKTSDVNTAFDAFSKQSLDTLLQTLTDTQGSKGAGFTKDAAIADSQGLVQGLFNKYSKEVVPQIVAQGGQGGVYNSTGVQALANDAFASTVAKGAELQLGAIKDYAGIQQQAQNSGFEAILAALGLQAKAYSTSDSTGNSATDTVATGTKTSKGTTVQTGKSSGMSASANFSFGG